MSKTLVPRNYIRKVMSASFVKRGRQRQAVGSHVLCLSCGHIKYIQGTLRVPRRTRCFDCWMADGSPQLPQG
jgi:hypothetical protein